MKRQGIQKAKSAHKCKKLNRQFTSAAPLTWQKDIRLIDAQNHTGTMPNQNIHHGRNIKRIREIKGIKQEALALELGTDWNQKKISLLESKETIDEELLALVAGALKVTPEVIKTYCEHTALTYINNHTFNALNNGNHLCTFNPMDKIVELYDALLKSEREKIALLERMLDGRK